MTYDNVLILAAGTEDDADRAANGSLLARFLVGLMDVFSSNCLRPCARACSDDKYSSGSSVSFRVEIYRCGYAAFGSEWYVSSGHRLNFEKLH